jgi:cytochrome c55X
MRPVVAIWQWWREALVIACCAAVPQTAMADPAPDPAKLSNLVRQDCGSCHGLTLKGGLGKPLTAQHLRQWDRDQLVHIILDGVPGTPMPGWRPLLTESEAGWIADFLQQETQP